MTVDPAWLERELAKAPPLTEAQKADIRRTAAQPARTATPDERKPRKSA